MKLLGLLCSCLVIQLSYAQCGSKLNDAAQCMGDYIKQKMEELPKHPDKEKVKGQIDQCFADSGCKNPREVEDDREGMHPDVMDRFAGMMGLNNMSEVFKAAHKCGKEMKTMVKPEVEKCIQTKPQLSDFSFPDIFDELDENGESKEKPSMMRMMKFFGGGGKHHHKKMMRVTKDIVGAVYDEQVCPTESSRKNAQSCIENVFDSFTPEMMKCKTPINHMFFYAEQKTAFCTQRTKCQEQLQECAAVKRRLPRYMCECGSEYLDANFNLVFDFMKECMKRESGVELPDSQSFIGRAVRMVSGKMMHHMCKREGPGEMNPCEGPLFRKHGHGGPHHGGRHGPHGPRGSHSGEFRGPPRRGEGPEGFGPPRDLEGLGPARFGPREGRMFDDSREGNRGGGDFDRFGGQDGSEENSGQEFGRPDRFGPRGGDFDRYGGGSEENSGQESGRPDRFGPRGGDFDRYGGPEGSEENSEEEF